MVSDTDVISDWLTVPEIVELSGAKVTEVKRWLHDRELVARRRGPNNALMVPATFLVDGHPLPSLRGTVTVLADSGWGDDEIIDWLHEADDTLPGGSAIESLRNGSKTEVRRRAQEAAF